MQFWYRKEKLNKCEDLVKKGYRDQSYYDNLEIKMKTFSLDYQEITNEVVNIFENTPVLEEICYAFLLSDYMGFHFEDFFDDEDIFVLLDLFNKECRKRKITIGRPDNIGKIGMPWFAPFWRCDEPLITKIVYVPSHGCGGMNRHIHRCSWVITKEKFEYVRDSLMCGRIFDTSEMDFNTTISVSYYPNSDEMYHYKYGLYKFSSICKLVKEIIKNHKEDCDVCDAEADSFIISYSNGRKRMYRNFFGEETKVIRNLYEQYMPLKFKNIIDKTDENQLVKDCHII